MTIGHENLAVDRVVADDVGKEARCGSPQQAALVRGAAAVRLPLAIHFQDGGLAVGRLVAGVRRLTHVRDAPQNRCIENAPEYVRIDCRRRVFGVLGKPRRGGVVEAALADAEDDGRADEKNRDRDDKNGCQHPRVESREPSTHEPPPLGKAVKRLAVNSNLRPGGIRCQAIRSPVRRTG